MRDLVGTLTLASLLTVPVALAAQPAQATPDATEMASRARRLTTDGRLDEAVSLFNNALKVDPELFEAYLGLGIALDLQGQYAPARRQLESALARATDATRGTVLGALAVSYVFESKTAEAAKYYQQVFDFQTSGNALESAASTANALGRVYLEAGDVESAERWYRTGYETAQKLGGLPADQTDLWQMRWLHAQSRIAARRGDAVAASRHAVALAALVAKNAENEKQRPIHSYLLGYNALHLGQADAAVTALQEADMSDPFILRLLAEASEKKGDRAAARGYWTKALASNGHSLQNALTRERAKAALGTR